MWTCRCALCTGDSSCWRSSPISLDTHVPPLVCSAALLWQVKVKVCGLYGCLPYVRRCQDQLGSCHPTAAFAVAQLVAGGEVVGLETKTTYAETTAEGCSWSEWLTFCVKVQQHRGASLALHLLVHSPQRPSACTPLHITSSTTESCHNWPLQLPWLTGCSRPCHMSLGRTH